MPSTNPPELWSPQHMTDPNTNSPLTPAAPGPKKNAPVLTRIFVSAIVVLLTLAAIGIAIPWAAYRCRHIVIGEATIKGKVTKIGARIEGRVRSIDVEVGQRICKGQVLLRLEDTHLQAALDRARAELQSATKGLESEKSGIEQTRKRLTLEIQRVQGVTNKAAGELKAEQSDLITFEKQYQAVAELLKTGAAARLEMDRITGARDHARAAVEAKLGVLESAQSSYDKAMNELDGVHVREQRLGV